MFKNSQSLRLVGLVTLACLFGLTACSQMETTQREPLPAYDLEAVTQARALIEQGYGLLAADDVDGAVAKFTEIEQLVPSGLVGPYHAACAYSRSGNLDAALDQLAKLAAAGYDDLEAIKSDSDLEPLADQERFATITSQIENNAAGGLDSLANGMPEYGAPPITFATEEELNEWHAGQIRQLSAQRTFRTTTAHTMAYVDQVARKLAAEKELKADDPEYDFGLERVRQACRKARIMSWSSPGWGVISDMVRAEVDKYLLAPASEEAAAEANFMAAVALSLKYSDDDEKIAGYGQAALYLARIEEGREFFGAAQTLGLVNRLQLPGADEAALSDQLKDVVNKFGGEDYAYRVLSTRMANGLARFIWPLPLDVADLEGQTITLGEYQGKALLIDFWAIWCPPCRAELPKLVENYKKYHDRGFEIVSISLDYADETTPEDYLRWADSAGMNWRHTYDGDGWQTALVKKYFVGSIPSPFLVGPDGSLAAWGEECRGDNLAENIEKALGI